MLFFFFTFASISSIHKYEINESKTKIKSNTIVKLRFDNVSDDNLFPVKYIIACATSKNIKTIHEKQTIEDMKKEYMLLGLRKLEGVKISEFKLKFGENPIYLFKNELEKLCKQDLIEVDLDNIKLTNEGLDFANLVWEEFV